jgi:glucose-1-phosphate adenylyltransferase
MYERLFRDAARKEASRHDFGHDIIPEMLADSRVFAYPFRDENRKEGAYWRDVGTLDAYFDANLDLTDTVPHLNMYDRNWPIWTDQIIAAPAKFVHDDDGRRGMAISSLISQDCIVSGALARRSMLFTGVKMGSWSSVEEAVILPYCNIGRHARLKRVILDSGVRIPEGLVVGEDPELDARRFRRTENGVCLITKSMIERIVEER